MKATVTMEIDLLKLVDTAVEHMDSPDDLRWSIGMALQEMYPDEWSNVLENLLAKYLALNPKRN